MVFDVGDHLYAIWWCAPRAYGRLVSAFEERTTQVKPYILKASAAFIRVDSRRGWRVIQ